MYAGRIYADFQNLDDENRIRLDTDGSRRDLTGRSLSVGDTLPLYTDDADDAGNPDPLLAEGVVEQAEETLAVRVDWAKVRHASDEVHILKKRFFDTAIGDMLRALDGRALVGATTLGMCVIDHLGFLKTGSGESGDFKEVVKSYLKPFHEGYNPDWLWEVRNGLVHAHGAAEKVRTGRQPLGAVFTHLHPDWHLRTDDQNRCLNVESFAADVIAAAWAAFVDFGKAPEKPLEAYRHLLIVHHLDAAADKPYGDMHRWLTQLDWVPLQREWLANDIRKDLQSEPKVGRLIA